MKIDFHSLLSNTDANVDLMIQKLYAHGAMLVGSRRINMSLDLELKPDTDWDFMLPCNQANEDKLKELGFRSANLLAGYGDQFTLDIYKHETLPIEVTVKDPDHYEDLIDFWLWLSANPYVFVKFFWKSSPEGVDVEEIPDLVNYFVGKCNV